MATYDKYQTPLASRYASDEMMAIFSARERATTWRKLWLWLAEAEKDLGVDNISNDALDQMRRSLVVSDNAFTVAKKYEETFRHDVMAFVHAFGVDAPAAAPFIHLGATSCYVTDNADLILQKRALGLILPKLAKVISNLQTFAMKWKDLPCLAFTHYQPAQLITVGKRAAQWLQNLVMDLEQIEAVHRDLKFRGAQGTTGSQASFLELFKGDSTKIKKLNQVLCEKAGFSLCFSVSAQTYTRKADLLIANAVAGLGATAQQICTDLRHLASQKEIEEPFEKTQIGCESGIFQTFPATADSLASAMAYKRNPMRSERICALGRKLARMPGDFLATFETQWFERTLDDSAIRRIDIPELFLLADAILIAMDNVTDGLVVYPNRILARINEELPFMATEVMIMRLAAHGVSRQDAHEEIRVLSHQASDVVKKEGGQNDLIQRIKKTEFFRPIWDDLDDLLDPKMFIGNCPQIVEDYCGEVEGALSKYRDRISQVTTAQLLI
jgi:adenylosuccinate lyase